MMKDLKKIFVEWVPFAIVVTGLCGLVYVAVQQNYRQSLNDPQIQMAEDAALALDTGVSVAALVPKINLVDVSQSLSPFLVIYDESGNVVASTGYLPQRLLQPPQGVFDLVRAKGNNLPHNTWEPIPGVRIASVMIHTEKKHGFVLAGRNMREVEARASSLLEIVALAWVVILGAAYAGLYARRKLAQVM